MSKDDCKPKICYKYQDCGSPLKCLPRSAYKRNGLQDAHFFQQGSCRYICCQVKYPEKPKPCPPPPCCGPPPCCMPCCMPCFGPCCPVPCPPLPSCPPPSCCSPPSCPPPRPTLGSCPPFCPEQYSPC